MLFLTAVWVPFSAISAAVTAVLSMGHIFTLPILFSVLRSPISLLLGTLRLITGTIDFLYPEALFAFTLASAALGIILPSIGDRIDEELPNILQLFGKLRHKIASFQSAHLAVSRIVRTFYVVYLISQTHLDQFLSK